MVDGCHACGCDAPQLRCGACSAARYCTAACQRRHWPAHKLVCASLRQRAAAAAAVAAGAAAARAPASRQPGAPDCGAAAAVWGELPVDAPLGANLAAKARRAWEQTEVGRRAPELLARAPALAQLVAAFPGVAHAAVEGKGRGLVAAAAFAAGDTILREEAVCWFPHWGLDDSEGALDLLRVRPAHRAHLEGLLLQLAPYMADSARAASALAGDADLCSLTRSQLISCVALESAFGVRVDGARRWSAPPAATGAAGGTGSDAPARTIDAICPVASLCNHSCEPNVAWVTDGPRSLEGVAIRLVAQRAIAPGQELCIAYKPSTSSPRRARRDALTSQYGFACGCRRCSRDEDDTVAFACGACGGGPVRLREVAAAAARAGGGGGGGGGVPPHTAASCAQCGADQASALAACAGDGAVAPTAAAAAGPGSGGGSLTAVAVAALMTRRAQTLALPLPRLLEQRLLHAGDVALFEARFNALTALLLRANGELEGEGGGADQPPRGDDGAAGAARVGAFFTAVAGPLRQLAAGCLAFLPHASHYLESFKRKRVLRDCALALVAAGGDDAGAGGGAPAPPLPLPRVRELLAEAARIEATETGPGGRRAALLAALAERPPAPADVPRVHGELTVGAL